MQTAHVLRSLLVKKLANESMPRTPMPLNKTYLPLTRLPMPRNKTYLLTLLAFALRSLRHDRDANEGRLGKRCNSLPRLQHVFSLAAGIGSVTAQITVANSPSTNLDALLELLNAAGTVLATSNPLDTLATGLLSYSVPSAGTYYLRVSGVGKGDPKSTGYSNYGSLGQYSISGTAVSCNPTCPTPAPSPTPAPAPPPPPPPGTSLDTYTVDLVGA